MLPASGTVLVASRLLGDPSFMRTVVYLVEHDHDGSLGFIVNRPLDILLGDLWQECPSDLSAIRIAAEGGPVDRHKGLLLHGCADISGAQAMGGGVSVGGDLEELVKRFANGPGALGPRLLLGHSGWTAGQLDNEIAQGAWVVRPATPDVLLTALPPATLWQQLLDGGTLPEPSLN